MLFICMSFWVSLLVCTHIQIYKCAHAQHLYDCIMIVSTWMHNYVSDDVKCTFLDVIVFIKTLKSRLYVWNSFIPVQNISVRLPQFNQLRQTLWSRIWYMVTFWLEAPNYKESVTIMCLIFWNIAFYIIWVNRFGIM